MSVFTIFNAYVLRFFEPIAALAQRYTLLQSAMAGAERVFSLLDVQERDAAPERAAPDGDPGLSVRRTRPRERERSPRLP